MAKDIIVDQHIETDETGDQYYITVYKSGKRNRMIKNSTEDTNNNISLSEFYRRLDIEDHAAIINSPDPIVQAWVERLKAANQDKGYIDMDHPDMILGETKLKESLLTEEKADKLFKKK